MKMLFFMSARVERMKEFINFLGKCGQGCMCLTESFLNILYSIVFD